MNKEFTFGGITVFQLDDMSNKLECVYDNDNEILLLTKKTYRHREEGLNFDYKYAVSALNIAMITEDEQFTEDNAFDVSIYLIVSPTSLDKEVEESIRESYGGYCDYQDIYFHGLGVRLLHENHSIEGIDEFVYKVGNIIEFLDSVRGFYLDRPVNKIGSTGWDLIFNCLDGKSFIKRTLERV